MTRSRRFLLATAFAAGAAVLSGCTDIGTPQGGGPGSGTICVTVSTNEKGPVTVDIQAVAIGGPNALTKYNGSATANGPFKGLKVCTLPLPGDPELQQWEVVVTVTAGGKQIGRKSFGPQTYQY